MVHNDLNFSDKPKISNSDCSHLRIGAKASATIQFRQKVAPKTPPKVGNYYLLKWENNFSYSFQDLPVGKTAMDQIYLTISGLDGVVGGIANIGTCFDKGKFSK